MRSTLASRSLFPPFLTQKMFLIWRRSGPTFVIFVALFLTVTFLLARAFYGTGGLPPLAEGTDQETKRDGMKSVGRKHRGQLAKSGGGGAELPAEKDRKQSPSSDDWESVAGTGGQLLKRVLVANPDGAIPLPGTDLRVHYVGRLASDGKLFDSSRVRGVPFQFLLGHGRVIRGWDVGLATMRYGETAVLRCLPSYAYGDRGFPPVIPGNATLDFEVELIPE